MQADRTLWNPLDGSAGMTHLLRIQCHTPQGFEIRLGVDTCRFQTGMTQISAMVGNGVPFSRSRVARVCRSEWRPRFCGLRKVIPASRHQYVTMWWRLLFSLKGSNGGFTLRNTSRCVV